MKKVQTIIIFISILSFINCSTDTNENTNNQKAFLKATINGQELEYGNVSSQITSFVEATLWDNKRLVIKGYDIDLNTNLELTVGETFLENPIQEGTYKIGTQQDNLETNILHFNSADTNMNNTASTEDYLGVYGCNVLDSNQVGEINIISLDTKNKIISGTFSGTLFRWIDITTRELKNIIITNGTFTLPYIDKSVEDNPDKNIISARVNGFSLVTDDPGSPDSRRSLASGIDKIHINGYDGNFGRIKIAVSSDVNSGNNYYYQPDGSFQSLGIHFENRINLPENLLNINPNQSNDSYISIIDHDPETNIIEGTFYIENSEIMGRTITDGYFKVEYVDDVD